MPWHADLHSHTTASDGRLSPAELVALAAEAGVRVLAVTDHDTTAGVEAARRAACAHPHLEIVAGIEISAWLGHEIHILGLFVDPTEAVLQRAMTRRALERRERVREIAARLARLGAPVDSEAILAAAAAAPCDDDRPGNVGRPHVARALLSAGHVTTMEEAFKRFLGRDAPAYVPVPRLEAKDAVALIHGAGGIASLAHPGIEDIDELIPSLAGDALDALEIRHPRHDEATVARYAGLAGLLGLLGTGGADFHGLEGVQRPGDVGVSAIGLAQLRARAPNPH